MSCQRVGSGVVVGVVLASLAFAAPASVDPAYQLTVSGGPSDGRVDAAGKASYTFKVTLLRDASSVGRICVGPSGSWEWATAPGQITITSQGQSTPNSTGVIKAKSSLNWQNGREVKFWASLGTECSAIPPAPGDSNVETRSLLAPQTTQTTLADLVISDFRRVGSQVKITVKNQGSAAVSGNFAVFLEPAGTPPIPGAPVPQALQITGGLPVGQSKAVSLGVLGSCPKPPSFPPGLPQPPQPPPLSMRILATADFQNQVQESHEDNNRSQPLTMTCGT